MLTFLEVNRIRMKCTTEKIVEVGLFVANKTMGYEALRDWVIDYRL